MKENIINKFIGAYDERDEYQKQEIYKELAFSGIIFYYMSMLLMVISLIIDTYNNEMSLITPILVVLNIGYSAYIAFRLNKKQVDISDCATSEEYNIKKAKLRRSSIIVGIQWGFWMIVMMEYILPFIGGGGGLSFSWFNMMIWFIGGLLLSVFIYYVARSKLKKRYDEME